VLLFPRLSAKLPVSIYLSQICSVAREESERGRGREREREKRRLISSAVARIVQFVCVGGELLAELLLTPKGPMTP
jgi:hypothetical protein